MRERMNITRRAALMAAPALAAVAVLPATAGDATPITHAYREWVACIEWLDSHSADDVGEDEYARLISERMDFEDAILSTPAQDARDVLAKLMIATLHGDVEMGEYVRGIAPSLIDEAKALLA